MTLKIETVSYACDMISQQIAEAFKNLSVQYVVHHQGHRTEALSLATHKIIEHPAAEIALQMLQKTKKAEDSSYLGTAVARKKMMFGLLLRDTILSLCTINIDQAGSLKEAQREAWHLAWHAIDAREYQSHSGSISKQSTGLIVRRRSAIEMASANLKADAFSCTLSYLNGDKDAALRTARARSMGALSTRSLHSPEFYPFAIAKEALDYALKKIASQNIPKKSHISTALKIANEVGMAFDEQSLVNWLSFSEPAQDMAWRGYPREKILSAAINTSPDTQVRALGCLVSEVSGIAPTPFIEIQETYSPYADDKFNAKLHETSVDCVFEDIIAQCLDTNSPDPFLSMANMQNELLTEGHSVGWCASALQAAARGFEYAAHNGNEPSQLARREFDTERHKTAWGSLRDLGRKIVDQQRHGHIVTMGSVQKLCDDIKDADAIQKSVAATIADPSYRRKMAATKGLAPRMEPQPAGPALIAGLDLSGPRLTAAPPVPGGKTATIRTAVKKTASTQESDAAGDGKDSLASGET